MSRRAVAAGHRVERLIADLFDMSGIRNGTLTVVPVLDTVKWMERRGYFGQLE